jgi:hypothetical protein
MSADALRAKRLPVTMQVLDVVDDYDAGHYPEPAGLLERPDIFLYDTASQEDRLLAEACLEAERDLRRREWAALEVLLASIPLGGSVEDIYDLSADRALPAIRAAQVCGWLRKAGA